MFHMGAKKSFALEIRYHSMVRKALKKIIRLGQGVHNLVHSPVEEKYRGYLPI